MATDRENTKIESVKAFIRKPEIEAILLLTSFLSILASIVFSILFDTSTFLVLIPSLLITTIFSWANDRKEPRIAKILTLFLIFTFISILITKDTPELEIWISGTFVVITIFILMSIGLNIHTGMTGMVNFGVIFFVAIGAVTTGLLNSKYGVSPVLGMTLGVILAYLIGYLTAYPTVKLRSDYFAIVTIALGEIFRITLNVETTFRSRTEASGISSPGIANIKGPLENEWDKYVPDDFFFAYVTFRALIALILLITAYVLSERLLNSPFGRILKTIREDEDVVESYGYDVFKYKATSLGIGAGIMAAAGALWAWNLGSIFPDFLLPASSTFLVWAAFVIGGKGNNKGMIVGAAYIVFLERESRTLPNPDAQNSLIDHFTGGFDFLGLMDYIFRFIIIDVGGFLFGKTSYQSQTLDEGNIHLDVNYLRFVVIGLIIILSMRYFSDGFIPEQPYRPKKTYTRSIAQFEKGLICGNCSSINDVGVETCTSCGEQMNRGDV